MWGFETRLRKNKGKDGALAEAGLSNLGKVAGNVDSPFTATVVKYVEKPRKANQTINYCVVAIHIASLRQAANTSQRQLLNLLPHTLHLSFIFKVLLFR